ncbi:MAG: phosphatidylserine/phosphatidylglycerophosphate/cardiolipin synthase family protein [Deltaproteobacteria bacterium]|nr:MAG: phosphatidylserine/phosphatidylglycerophosphate/cardiolipin synthase family protein [Deltaproteobacteria bacterium]
MRWDRVPDGCHHQKSYVIDDSLAFVGGVNLTREALSTPEHDSEGFHDLFVELRGPAVADVAHNFAQRWNQASETLARGLAFPDPREAGPVPMPVPPQEREAAGSLVVHVQRTIRRHLYRGPAGWPGEREFDIDGGDRGVRSSLLGHIDAARRSLYIENQFLMDPDTIDAIGRAATRGVEVIAVVPLEPDRNLLLYPEERMRETRAALKRLAEIGPGVGLFGLARRDDPKSAIYVHAKLMIADDESLCIGSANLWPPSYFRDSELQVDIPDEALATETRLRLWKEHGAGEHPRRLSDWQDLGREGRDARERGRPMPSRIVAIDPREYYRFPEGLEAPWKAVSRSHDSPELAEAPNRRTGK